MLIQTVAERPPHVASVFRVLALLAVELAVDDGGAPLVLAAVGLGAEFIVATRAVDVGHGQKHVE